MICLSCICVYVIVYMISLASVAGTLAVVCVWYDIYIAGSSIQCDAIWQKGTMFFCNLFTLECSLTHVLKCTLYT